MPCDQFAYRALMRARYPKFCSSGYGALTFGIYFSIYVILWEFQRGATLPEPEPAVECQQTSSTTPRHMMEPQGFCSKLSLSYHFPSGQQRWTDAWNRRSTSTAVRATPQ